MTTEQFRSIHVFTLGKGKDVSVDSAITVSSLSVDKGGLASLSVAVGVNIEDCAKLDKGTLISVIRSTSNYITTCFFTANGGRPVSMAAWI